MINDTTQLLVADARKSMEALNSLLRGEMSAVETYSQALEKFGAEAPAELFDCHRSHESRAHKLRARIHQLGGTPDSDSGAWGTFARLVERGAEMLGRKSAIAALEEGEDHGLAEYRDKLDDVDAESRRLIEAELLPEQQATHDAIRNLSQDAV